MVTRSERAAAERSAALLGIAANTTRLLIVQVLQRRRGAYVGEIVEETEMTQSAISHQLRLLQEGGIVVCEKEGREVHYMLSKKPAAQRLLRALRALAR